MLGVDDPTETLDPLLRDYPAVAIITILGLVLFLVALGWFVIRSAGNWLAQAALQNNAPSSLILALSFLTLVAVIGALFTKDESAWTLAATGMGALAASLTSYFQLTRERAVMREQILNQEREQEDHYAQTHYQPKHSSQIAPADTKEPEVDSGDFAMDPHEPPKEDTDATDTQR